VNLAPAHALWLMAKLTHVIVPDPAGVLETGMLALTLTAGIVKLPGNVAWQQSGNRALLGPVGWGCLDASPYGSGSGRGPGDLNPGPHGPEI
jgi:hypothetical protein